MAKELLIYKKNILSPNVLNNISERIMGDNFPWFFSKSTTFKTDKEEDYKINYSWFHTLFFDGKINSDFYNVFYYPIMTILENFKQDMDDLIRIRIGLITSVNKPVINPPHIDSNDPHKVILFYLNDSDGDTIFYKNDRKTQIKRITPVSNTAVFFNGDIPHSSSKPVNFKRRIVFNINLKTK